jgi:serine/threonine protein kinase, bacterial
VDMRGTVYVADRVNNLVVALAAGSSAQQVLPFTGLHYPGGVAVDGGGNLYITDSDNDRVLKLPVQ